MSEGAFASGPPAPRRRLPISALERKAQEMPQRRPSAARPGGIDEARTASARRHSAFVAVMKGLLPGLAVCLVLVFVFYSQGGFAPSLPDDFTFDPGDLGISGAGIRMVSPKLSGLDENNQRFEVSAASAMQAASNPALITMEGIRARMTLKDGGWVRVEARGGEFDSDINLLTLVDDIEVTMSSGYVARLNGAKVDFNKGTLESGNPVLVFTDAGIISANAVQILDKGKLVRFTDGASMTINADQIDTEPLATAAGSGQ
jgi:lipopolysaccharide export system protein LptC